MTIDGIWQFIKNHAAKQLTVRWSGGGDEGHINSVELIGAGDREIFTVDFRDPVYRFVEELINPYVDGNGDDSSATIEFDVATKTVTVHPSYMEWVDGDPFEIVSEEEEEEQEDENNKPSGVLD